MGVLRRASVLHTDHAMMVWGRNGIFVKIIFLRKLPAGTEHSENCVHQGWIASIYMRVWAIFFFQSFIFFLR